VAAESGAYAAGVSDVVGVWVRVQHALRRLTQLFERIWYGLRPAAESDYADALILFEELRGA
jgi:hypothetical protein